MSNQPQGYNQFGPFALRTAQTEEDPTPSEEVDVNCANLDTESLPDTATLDTTDTTLVDKMQAASLTETETDDARTTIRNQQPNALSG